MGSKTFPGARWARSTLVGGLVAALATVVFVASANGTIFYTPYDDRHQVPNTAVNPYSAVVEITLGLDDAGVNLGACTGWLYAPNMIATAAHCVYVDPSKVAGGYVHTSGMRVWPGINGSTATTPFPSCGVVASHVASGYLSGVYSFGPQFDYAALKLDCTFGSPPGMLNYSLPPTVGYATRVVGYPSDKAWDTQWYSDDQVRTFDAYLVYYANDTVERMSGAPVMEWTGSAWTVVAIHSRGCNTSYNCGPRITSTVANDLYNWRYYG
jgi:V8-like Glu-specific endopeptidase